MGSQPRHGRRWLLPLAAVLVSVAALAMSALYITPGGRALLGSEPEQLARFEVPEQLPREIGPAERIRILHFWDPDCACEPANRVHLEALLRRFGQQRLEILVVPAAGARRPEDFRAGVLRRARWPDAHEFQAPEGLPASPAAAVYDRDGVLRYFGPYSMGGSCAPDGSGLVESVLTALGEGEQPQPRRLSVVGCYCDWPASARLQ